MTTPRCSSLVAALALVACACGGAPATEPSTTSAFPLDAYAALATGGGAYRVELRTSPNQPPQRGELQIELRVRDSGGAPVDGLAVDVEPWMPAMGHGTSVMPSVLAEGDGTYRADHVALFMPGTWQLRVTLGSESLTVPVTVQ
jgi:hypothetical protein